MEDVAVFRSIDKIVGVSFFDRLQGINEYKSYSQDDIDYLLEIETLLKRKGDQFSLPILNEFALKFQISLSSLTLLLVDNSRPHEEEFIDDENKKHKEVYFKIIDKPGYVIEDALSYAGYKYAAFRRVIEENLSSKVFFDRS